MEPIEISVEPDLDRQEVSNIFSNYDLVSLPVVDSNSRLIGRITSDDILDVVNEEAEEDLFALAGINEYNHPIYSGFISNKIQASLVIGNSCWRATNSFHYCIIFSTNFGKIHLTCGLYACSYGNWGKCWNSNICDNN